MPYAVIKLEYLAYDGTNDAEMLAFTAGDRSRIWKVADTAEVEVGAEVEAALAEASKALTLEGAGAEGRPLQRKMQVGDVMVRNGGEVVFRTAAEFAELYIPVTPADQPIQ